MGVAPKQRYDSLRPFILPHKLFDTPDMALFGWDDDAPIYACMACNTAQKCLHADAGESAPLEGESTPEVLSTSQAESNPAPRW
jgi:hypothetical protein